jgi:hypothetical protein
MSVIDGKKNAELVYIKQFPGILAHKSGWLGRKAIRNPVCMVPT